MNGMSLHPNPKGAPTGCQISITRHSAAKDFSVWRQASFHHGPENGIQKTSRDAQREKACVNTYAHASASQIRLQNICGQQQIPSLCVPRPLLYKEQIGTHRGKKHMLTLTLMLVRRKSACKTSAGSSKIFRWLAPLLGPNLDPKPGPGKT